MSAEYPSENCLLTMPDVVMNKLLGKLDFPAIQCLRKTCSTLRNFIDDVKPDSKLINLYITIMANCISLSYFFDENVFVPKYWINREGCSVEWDGRDGRSQKKLLLKSEDFVDVASKDIISVLTNQKPVVKFLKLRCQYNTLKEQREVSEQFLSNLESYLASKTIKLQVKTFDMKVGGVAQILHILPHLEVENLTIFKRRNIYYEPVLNMQDLIDLKQLKKLETLDICGFCVDLRIEDLVHLKKCFVKYKTIDTAMIEELKEAFRTSSHLETFRIQCEQSNIERLMDPRYAGPHRHSNIYGRSIPSWFFSVSTPERVLKVSFDLFGVLFEFDLLVNVPEDATVN